MAASLPGPVPVSDLTSIRTPGRARRRRDGGQEDLASVQLSSRVYDILKHRLVTRELAPDQKISLHELARELGVSRSPVHHALTRLVSEGLLSVKARKGYYVRPLTAEMMVEAHDVRLAIELHAAARTVGRLSTAQLADLRRLCDETLAFLDGEEFVDKEAFIIANQAFHQQQIALAANHLMSDLYRRLSVNMLQGRILWGLDRMGARVAAEHIAIMDAFESGDLDRVCDAIRDHVETGRMRAVAAIEAAGGIL